MSLWIISIALAVVVTIVVGLLLWLILTEVKRIEQGVSQIWDVGQMIAANTIHVPALNQTNSTIHSMTAQVPDLLASLEQIETHAQACDDCPNCLND